MHIWWCSLRHEKGMMKGWLVDMHGDTSRRPVCAHFCSVCFVCCLCNCLLLFCSLSVHCLFIVCSLFIGHVMDVCCIFTVCIYCFSRVYNAGLFGVCCLSVACMWSGWQFCNTCTDSVNNDLLCYVRNPNVFSSGPTASSHPILSGS